MANKLKIYKLSNTQYKDIRSGGIITAGGSKYSWEGDESAGIISIKKAVNVTIDNESFVQQITILSSAVTEINDDKLPKIESDLSAESSDRKYELNKTNDRVTVTETGISALATDLNTTKENLAQTATDLYNTEINLANEIERAKGIEEGISITASSAYTIANKASEDIAILSIETDKITAEVFDTLGSSKISKLEIRADGLESDVYDPSHGLSKIEQKADSVTTTVTDLTKEGGRISQIEQTTSAISVTVGSHAEFIASEAATKDWVNSTVSTNTGTFQGTKDAVTDLELTYGATTAEVIAKLNVKISGAKNNDYCFVINKETVTAENTVYQRYKYVTAETTWKYEYSLNNSSFTEAQWAAITSGITASKVTNYEHYSDDISNLTVETGKIAARVGTAETNIATITSDVSEHTTTLSTHTAAISGLTQTTASIDARVGDTETAIISQGLAIAGKSTITKGDTAPDNPKNNDLWFFTGTQGYEDVGDAILATLTSAAKYVDYYVKAGEEYILVTVANYSTLAIEPKVTRAYRISGKQTCKWYSYTDGAWTETTDATIVQAKENIANLTINTDKITSEVKQAQTDINDRYTKSVVDSKIEQSASEIKQEVSETYETISGAAETYETINDATEYKETTNSTLEQHASQIAAKVESTGGGESKGFGWALNENGFTLNSKSGSGSYKTVMAVTASGLTVDGTVNANAGKIGPLIIDSVIVSSKDQYRLWYKPDETTQFVDSTFAVSPGDRIPILGIASVDARMDRLWTRKYLASPWIDLSTTSYLIQTNSTGVKLTEIGGQDLAIYTPFELGNIPTIKSNSEYDSFISYNTHPKIYTAIITPEKSKKWELVSGHGMVKVISATACHCFNNATSGGTIPDLTGNVETAIVGDNTVYVGTNTNSTQPISIIIIGY